MSKNTTATPATDIADDADNNVPGDAATTGEDAHGATAADSETAVATANGSADPAASSRPAGSESDAATQQDPTQQDPAQTAPTAAAPGRVKSTFLVLGATVRRFALPVVAALAVAALAAAGILGWQLKQQHDIDAASAAAVDAARAYGVTLTSIDTNALDQDFAAVLDGATGEFKDMYSRASGQLRQLLVDNKATGEGTVLDAAVKSASTTKVEVLLFIDQTVTNAAVPDPRVDRSRVAMTMELVDGRWLASRVYLP